MALKGLRVVEMAGLAPAPLAGMILAGETANTKKLRIISHFFLRFWSVCNPCGQAQCTIYRYIGQVSPPISVLGII